MLQSINNPSDLKRLPPAKLKDLSQEIRELLINTVARTGGHLAANLGVVELTLALHYVYDLPKDKIVWDVGHQTYVHKMLTGRLKRINSLRQYQGLSGFPRVDESPYDIFNTGHASTSISAAVGLALARDIRQENHSVVAVIGDGALTGGLAFEAMNHAGHLGLDFTVVLNDNAMSISPNVGALAGYLRKLRMDPAYSQTKEEVEQALLRIPGIGANLVKAAGKIKDMVKYLVVPGMLFEELGFTYLGPIDGHNIEEMIMVLRRSRHIKGPVLVHVITEKGKGYPPAVENPDVFHGIGPFDVATGKAIKSGIKTYTQVFGEFMVRKAESSPDLVAITAAMASGTGLSVFAEKYPDRFFDVGICEEHAVTMAAGLASGGLRPVVAIYSTFLQRSFDQIIHDVCLQNLPVVFAVDRAGLVGEDGPTHHGVFDLSYLRQIPNIIVMAPSNEDELNDMLDSALRYGQPVAVRYPRGSGEGVQIKTSPEYIPPGTARLLQEGDQVLLVAIGRMVNIAVKAAAYLRERGISAAVINARFAKPLDADMIGIWAARCRRVVTLEENVLMGGFGGAVAEAMNCKGISAEFLHLGIPDAFVDHGAVNRLLEDLGLDAPSVAASIVSRWPELLKQKAVRGL
ncbi:MAG: 1-deoxy-D-xylulose-5-phosphate synthase [Syntrophomonadaceae bacterium]|nr:1-deoxy-D-xylulose-5-phosphate synthase [Syntrophomonadaceae bacterium]